jgi:N utilization substance protein B
MGARRKARELALQMLFENDVAGTAPDEMFRRNADLQKAPSPIREFTEHLVAGTLTHRDELDEVITRQADHWRLARMPIVDRNILRLALFELLHDPATPRSSQFINGILDGVLKSRPGEAPATSTS